MKNRSHCNAHNLPKNLKQQLFSGHSIKCHILMSLKCTEVDLSTSVNPFVPNALFPYPLKKSGHLTVFWCFQGLEKGCIENKCVKIRICQHFELGASYLGKKRWNTKCGSGSIFIAFIQVSDFMHWANVVGSNSKAIDARKISILAVNRLT